AAKLTHAFNLGLSTRLQLAVGNALDTLGRQSQQGQLSTRRIEDRFCRSEVFQETAVTRGPTPGVMLRAIQSFIADFRLPIADLHHCQLPISCPPGAQNCSGQVTSPIGNWQSAIGNALAEACRNRTYLSLLSQSH